VIAYKKALHYAVLIYIKKQVAWNKSSIILKIIFQNTQLNENENYLQKNLDNHAKRLGV
jgi:hypothetical protein